MTAICPATARRAAFAALLILTALSFAPGAAKGATACEKFASPTGSDFAAGTEAAPFQTAQRLADSLTAGGTGCLREGSYTASGPYVLSPKHGGAPDSPIVIQSYPGEHARLIGIVNIAHGVDDVTLSNLTFEGTGGSNTIHIYSTDDAVEDSEITNAWRGLSCMMLGNNSGGGQAVRPTISGNTFHACGSLANGNKDHGLYASSVLEGEIVDNIFYDNAAYAVQIYPNAQRTVFAHNVVDGAAPSVRGGVVLGGDEDFASSGNVVQYNVIAYAQTYDIVSEWEGSVGSGNIARENCIWAGKGGELSNGGGLTASGNISANPEFLNRSTHDYRLSPKSACLAKVGYDTEAKLLEKEVSPQPAPTEPGPAPEPSPPPSLSPPPVSKPQPAPTPVKPAPAPAPESNSSHVPSKTASPASPPSRQNGRAPSRSKEGKRSLATRHRSLQASISTAAPRRSRREQLHRRG